MKNHPIYLEFGYLLRSRKKFGQKTTCPGMATFFHFSAFERKNHTFEYLEGIGKQLGRTKYLVIWLFEQLDESRQAPYSKNCINHAHNIL